MLLFLLLFHQIDACEIVNTTAYCDDGAAFANASASYPKLDELVLSSCPEVALNSDSLLRLDLNCTLQTLPPYFLAALPSLQHLGVRSCNLTRLPWQSIFSPLNERLDIDFSSCPFDCSCENQYIVFQNPLHDSHHNVKMRPFASCHFTQNCDYGWLKVDSMNVTTTVGGSFHVGVEFSDERKGESERWNYFKWVGKTEQPEFTVENISSNSAQLVVSNVTREHVGSVIFWCWHCREPLSATIEIRAELPLLVEIFDHGDSDELIVSGYPLDRLTLNITRLDRGEVVTQEQELPNGSHETTQFWHSLIVRESTSCFHERRFTVFTRSCSECALDHLSGNVTFVVCAHSTTVQCQAVHSVLDHLAEHSDIEDVVTVRPATSDSLRSAYPIIFLIILILITLAGYLIVRYHLSDYCYAKIVTMRKKTWTYVGEVDGRRESGATEQTFIRLEERQSLSSTDYSDRIIPFIGVGNIKMHQRIGRGAYGEVYCGSWDKTGERSVAVKVLIEAGDDVEKEARIISQLDHKNIVKLYGMTREGSRLLLVFELMNLGDLKTYLRDRAPQASNYSQFPPALTVPEMKKIIIEITKGLSYLGEQMVLHRDLAARNCLVHGESDLRCCYAPQRPPITVKISDFGMSRHMYTQDYYRMEQKALLPVRWLPPEAVGSNKYNHASDIWALGVTMWEIFSYGAVPFAELSNMEVISYNLAGIQLPKPKNCPNEIDALMRKCWAAEPYDRITTYQILKDPALRTAPDTTIITDSVPATNTVAITDTIAV